MYKKEFGCGRRMHVILALVMAFPAVASAEEGMPPRAAQELYTHTEILIDAPPARVWPYVLDTSAWKTGGTRRYISGKRGSVGEIVASIPRGQQQPAYFIETVELMQNKRRTIKLFALGERGPLLGYASWELREEEGKTRLFYHVYSEILLAPEAQSGAKAADLEASQREYVIENEARFNAEFQALKKLIESSSTKATGAAR